MQTKHISSLHRFYKDVMELQIVESDSNSFKITAGESQLIFEKADDSVNPFYHFAFNIPSNKIEEAYQWLQRRVELLLIEDYKNYIADFSGWHAKSVYFFDVAGNIVEFIARFDLNDIADEAFSSRQIRNISEIGIVYPSSDYDRYVHQLLTEYHLSDFAKQPPMQHFRAIGDDEGLFIVVPEHRNWYPTNIPCGIFALAVKFSHNNVQHLLRM